MAINETHSYKNYFRQSLADVDVAELNNSTIRGTCFYQEATLGTSARGDIERRIFPETMTGVIFDRCNLDNVYVPPGNTVMPNCCHRLIQVQNDLEDWILDDATLAPKEPIDKKRFQDLGVSINPADIPATPRVGESITQEKDRLSRQQAQLP